MNELPKLSYEQASAMLPEGWVLWGHYGDGYWRVSDTDDSIMAIDRSMETVVQKATELYKKRKQEDLT